MSAAEPFDVFLSHNSRDKPAVRKLAKALAKKGIKAWVDESELVPGRPWQEALEQIIETTKSAAVLVGKEGPGPWEVPEMWACLSEYVNRKLPVIPVLLPGAQGEPTLPLLLRQFTWVDLRKGVTEAGLQKLILRIRGQKLSDLPYVIGIMSNLSGGQPVRREAIPKFDSAIFRELEDKLQFLVGRSINDKFLTLKLEVGGEEFFIDLLFYHLRLRCYVVIDLKMKKFQPEFSGKMNFYLSAVDNLLRHAEDKPSIGIILCRARNEVVAEYALRDTQKPIGVSGFTVTEALPVELEGNLPTIEQLEEELDKVSATQPGATRQKGSKL